ncbi:hypothetical protein BLNAU_20644 [Blattamonas nauphoetae]|uniref:Protein kinase domain-containing protein n=1 Tax=Blattamonas nauphoetae TaxID=2049346 RepID=A0ABQ9X2B8_9EUKA|nr:hypothetical protein BLNAU_20644 [Blattamonas nauphoetae]
MEVGQYHNSNGRSSIEPIIPSQVCLSIAKGLQYIEKQDRHHVFFGRLSSHSVLFNDDDNVCLHVRGATEVEVSTHMNQFGTSQYVFDDIVDSKHLFTDVSEKLNKDGSLDDSVSHPETLEQRLLAESAGSSLSSQKEWMERTISSTDSHRSRSINSNSSQITSQTRMRPHVEMRTLIDGGLDHIRWRAPELSMGADVSIATAIFSLGMILWETHTRQVPFGEVPAESACIRLASGERPSLAGVSDTTQAMLIERCWAQDPRRRPGIEEVITILQEVEDTRTASQVMDDFSLDVAHDDDGSTESMVSLQI